MPLTSDGIGVPSLRVPGGVFGPRGSIDQAFSAVLLAVLTPTGSRPFARNFGSRLNRLLFDQRQVALDGTAAYIVRDAVARQCPNVRVVDVAVAPVGDESIGLEIVFSLLSDPTVQQTRRAFLRKSDLLQVIYTPSNG